MAFIPAGQNVNNRISFNSGTIDFGNSRLVQVDSVNMSIEYTLTPLFCLGSIKPQFYARHTQKVSLTGKIKSYAPEMDMLVLGSSAIGAPNQILTLDGQPTMTNPVLTMFDSNNKEIQYQLTGAVFKSTKMAAKMEDYAEVDFELESMDITEFFTA
jgi:hypothetical protein